MGSKTSGTTTTQESGPPDFQVPYLERLFSEATAAYGNQIQYPGFDQVAGFDPAETAGQESLLGFARGGAQDIFSGAQDAWKFATGDVLSPDSNPWLQQYGDALSSDVERDFTQRILPSLRGDEQAAGQFGGTRGAIAQGIAGGVAGEEMAQRRSELYNQAYNRGLGTFEAGLAFTPQLAQLGLQPGLIEGAVGGQRRELAQSRIDEQTQAFWFNQLEPWLRLSQYASLVGGNFGGQGTSTTDQPTSIFERLTGSTLL